MRIWILLGLILLIGRIHSEPAMSSTKSIPIPLPQSVVYKIPSMSTASRKIDTYKQQLACMTLNIYFEARNQASVDAMAAVGYTVMNRVKSRHYPQTVCDVVFQGKQDENGNYVRHRCQFSWVCDGKSDTPNLQSSVERVAWERSVIIAEKVLNGTIKNPIGKSIMYHALYVSPNWIDDYSKVEQIEDHIFYAAMPRT